MFRVFESNSGSLSLVVYDDAGKVEFVHTGYEFVPGQLMQDLRALADGDDPATDWDGNEIDDYTAEQVSEIDSVGLGELVADDSGIYLDRAGFSARKELGGDRQDDVSNALDEWFSDNSDRFEPGGDLSDFEIGPVVFDFWLRDFVANATDGTGALYTLTLGSDGNIYINS